MSSWAGTIIHHYFYIWQYEILERLLFCLIVVNIRASIQSIDFVLTPNFNLILANFDLLPHEILLLLEGSFSFHRLKAYLSCHLFVKLFTHKPIDNLSRQPKKICIQGSRDLNLRLYTSASCIVSTQCMELLWTWFPRFWVATGEFSFLEYPAVKVLSICIIYANEDKKCNLNDSLGFLI